MKSELIRDLFLAYAQGERDRFVETAYEIVKEEERQNHHLLAKDLGAILRQISAGQHVNGSSGSQRYRNSLPIPRDNEKGFPLLDISEPYLDWEDLILSENLIDALKQIVQENREGEILAVYSLRPKQKVLFCGPPGTGKTLSSQVLASILGYPLAHVRFDAIVSSFLGETAANLRKIFDFVEQGRWVVLFDEFDVIGKLRDDPYEHGEIKRVVNNFMQMLDSYSGESLLIAATNHHHLLDPGLWRRFDEILLFGVPDRELRVRLFEHYLRAMPKHQSLDLDELANQASGYSPADIARVCQDAMKGSIIGSLDAVDQEQLIRALAGHRRRKCVEGGGNGRTV